MTRGADRLVADIMAREIPDPPYSVTPPTGRLGTASLFVGVSLYVLTVPDMYDRPAMMITLTRDQFIALSAALPTIPVERVVHEP